MMLKQVLPQYRCHKIVNAAKILYLTREENSRGRVCLVLDLPGRPQMTLPVSDEWYAKHMPKPEGYLVAYEDGYMSYSPKKAFEDGYARIE